MSEAAVIAPPPRDNPSLIGQEAAERVLLQSHLSGRLPHGWMICGPRGIGKATLAFRFARYLLADSGAAPSLLSAPRESLSISEEHPVFRQVSAGTHPDLAVLERRRDDKGQKRQVIQVDEVRNAISFLQHTSTAGGWRVVVVDSADDLNRQAANAFLKILEEPPAKVALFLVTQNEGALMPTLRSRCCRLHLSPLRDEDVRDLARGWFDDLEESELDLLVRLAEGSPGRALALAEDGGVELYRAMVALLETLPRPPGDELHAFADRLAQGRDGTSFRTGVELLRWWIARMVRRGAGGSVEVSGPSGPEQELMNRLLDWRPASFWLLFWERLGRHALSAERVNLDRKQVILSAFLELETLKA